MTTEENKQLTIEGYRLFQEGKIAALLELYQDNAEWVGPESEFIPFAGHFHGKKGIAQFFAKLNAAVQSVRFEPRQFIAERDKVVVSGVSTWRAKATGITYDNPWVHIFTIRDNKVALFEAYFDTAPAERALYVGPSDQPSMHSQLHH